MKFERYHEPLLTRAQYFRRQWQHVGYGLLLIALPLGVGVIGYHFTEDLPWLDALLNAAMILSGEGPVAVMQSDAGKLFASFYALLGGVAFVSIVGIILAPAIHRFMHKFHVRESDKE